METVRVRVKDYDGMGGFEYEYFCDNCGDCQENIKAYCPKCGYKFTHTEIRDTWGYTKRPSQTITEEERLANFHWGTVLNLAVNRDYPKDYDKVVKELKERFDIRPK